MPDVDLPFKMRALARFIRDLVGTDGIAAVQAEACEDAANEIERLHGVLRRLEGLADLWDSRDARAEMIECAEALRAAIQNA